MKRCYFKRSVRLPTFCKKKFSFTINQVLNGISGVMDIILYPISKATDAILAAIPMPPLKLFPSFPSNFNVLNKLDVIANVLTGPTFPTDLLDFSSVDLALPGLNDSACGKSASELSEVLELAKKGDITPEFVREFYDDCDGFQDLNPSCSSTDELLCGDFNANSIIAEPISLSRYKDLKDASSDDHEKAKKNNFLLIDIVSAWNSR